MLNCSVILEGTAHSYPDEIAIVDADRRVTYGELDRGASRLASGLRQAGIGHGDMVLLACPNRLEFPIAYFGILKTGATVVPVSVLSKQRELVFLLEDTSAKACICFEGTDELPLGQEAWQAFQEVPGCRHFWTITEDRSSASPFAGAETLEELINGSDTLEGQEVACDTDPADTAVILYTSGTTGKPKGAELTHQNIFTTAVTSGRLAQCCREDILLVVLPLFHCYAQTVQMNAGFLVGSQLVLLRRFDPDVVLKTMEEECVTLFCGVPTMYWSLLHHSKVDQYDLEKISRNLRLGCSGGAPIPVEVLKGVEEKYNFPVLEGYGLSETSAMATFNQIHRPRKVGSVGLPVWGMTVRLVDEEMNDVSTGERGEVVIRGHAVMKGYFNRPEATAETFRGGWFHTGDVGTMDEDGYIYIVDRTNDMILRGGFNVYPREVEEVMISHPDITLAAVIGVSHEKYGQEVMGFVILREGASIGPDEISGWCKKQMAAYKYPRIVNIVDSLPLGSTGKVLKKELRKMTDTDE
jgi:long-chain acyl-CoA synthetase